MSFNKTFKDIISELTREAALKRYALFPAPYSAREIYDFLVPGPARRAALMLAERVPTVQPKTLPARWNILRLSVSTDGLDQKAKQAIFALPRGYLDEAMFGISTRDLPKTGKGEVVCDAVSLDVKDYPHFPQSVGRELLQWALQMGFWLREEYTPMHDSLDYLATYCNTPGQVQRLCPELVGYLPAHLRDRIRSQRQRSAVPRGFEMSHPAWTPERQAHMLQFLATTSMLTSETGEPVPEDSQGISI